jgi:cytokinin dehydrogenase
MRSQFSRRGFLHSVATASGSMIVGFDRQARLWVREAQTTHQPLEDVPKLDGIFFYDNSSRSAVATDFGNIVHQMPAAVLKPGSVQDIVRMVQYANLHSLKVAMRGQGHSTYGQSLVEAGILIDSSTLNGIKLSAHTVDAQAGAPWGEVAKIALAKGLTPPVMLGDSTQTVTVGGTLNIGGMGTTSHRFGAQVDSIEELDVVTGDGRLVTCSARERHELFNMVLAGVGQCALIVRARIRLVPAQSHVVLHDFFYNDLESFLSDQKRLALDEGRFDHLSGPIRRKGDNWSFIIGAGKFYTPPHDPNLASLKAGLRFNSVSEPVRIPYWEYLHRQSDTATVEAGGPTRRPLVSAQPGFKALSEIAMWIPGSKAKQFIESILRTPSDLALAFYFEVWPVNTRRFSRPLFRMPAEEFAFGVWIIDIAQAATEISNMLATHRSLYERMRAIGGTRYGGFGAVPFSQADWVKHFGPELWMRLAEAKKMFDPKQVLTPGPGVFGERTYT